MNELALRAIKSLARRIVGVQPSPLGPPATVSGEGREDGFTQAELLHLQFIQDVIARLGTYGSLIKGWSIAFAGVMFGIGAETSNAGMAMVVVPTALLFWSLDAYFLWSERCFRRLFDDVRAKRSTDPFFMAATSHQYLAEVRDSFEPPGSFDLRWRNAVTRPTLGVFYGGTAIAAVVIAVAIALSPLPERTGEPPMPTPSGELPSSSLIDSLASGAPTSPASLPLPTVQLPLESISPEPSR